MNTEAIPLSKEYAFEIIEASWRDLTPIQNLEKLCFPLDVWPLLDIIGVLTFPNIVRLKAVEGGECVGFVVGEAKKVSRVGWIASICVHPAYRGKGIGTVLMNLCEEEMRMPRVKLTVRESNINAIGIYQRRGYQQVGVWKKYYKGGENGIVMEKVIRES